MPNIHFMDISTLRRIDLNLLKSLQVLLDTGNVTRAAHQLHLSQPALSAQLRQLRETFGDPLLVPAGRGLTRTVMGDALIAPLRQLLQDVERLVCMPQAFDPARTQMTVRLLSTDLIHQMLSIPLVHRLRAAAPGLRVALLPLAAGRVAEQLARGEADIALLLPYALPAQAHQLPLYQERFVCVMRADHPAAHGRLTLERYCRYDHVLVSTEGGGFHGVVDDVLRPIGRRRRIAVSMPSFLMLPSLLAGSDLLCTVPQRVAESWRELPLVVRRPPCEVPGFDVAMGWHPRTDADPAQRWLRGQIQLVASSLDPARGRR